MRQASRGWGLREWKETERARELLLTQSRRAGEREGGPSWRHWAREDTKKALRLPGVCAVRITTRGCPMQDTRGLSQALCREEVRTGGRSARITTEECSRCGQGAGELTRSQIEGGAGKRGLKVGVTKTLAKKISFSKSSRTIYYLMETPIITFGKQIAHQSKAELLYTGFA